MKLNKISLTSTGLILFLLTTATAFAQTTAFTYQGRLTDGGMPARADKHARQAVSGLVTRLTSRRAADRG